MVLHAPLLLQPAMQREVSTRIVQSLLRTGGRVVTAAQAEMLLGFVGPLVREVEGLDLDEEVRGQHCRWSCGREGRAGGVKRDGM